jgi:hypothetical protein
MEQSSSTTVSATSLSTGVSEQSSSTTVSATSLSTGVFVETKVSVSITCADSKLTAVLQRNVWEAAHEQTEIDCRQFSSQIVGRFLDLIQLFPKDIPITKARCRGEWIQAMFAYLHKHIWTCDGERDWYELVHLATQFRLEAMEYILVRFLQEQFKTQHYHMSEQQAMDIFPSKTPIVDASTSTSVVVASTPMVMSSTQGKDLPSAGDRAIPG